MSRWSLALLVLGYVMTRGALVLGRFDEVAMPPFELGVMGNLAWLASHVGPVLPLHLWFDNVGGHLVVGFLAAPLYALLGDHYAVLKLVPLAFGVATLVLLVRLLERLAGPRAGWTVGLLFVFAPPTLAKYSVLAKGNHFEGLLLQVAAWSALVRCHLGPSGEAARSSAGRLFAAGLLAGLATSFYLGALVTVVGLGLAHLLLVGGRRASKDALPAGIGLGLGWLPLVALARAPDGRLLGFLEAKLAAGEPGVSTRFQERLVTLAEVLPRAGGWPGLGPVPATVSELAFLAAFALAWSVVALRLAATARRSGSRAPGARARTLLLLPAWLHLPLFALVFGLTTFDFDRYSPPVEVGTYRYLVPHLVFALALVAAVGPSSPRASADRGWWRPIGGAATAAAGLAALLGLAGLAQGHRIGSSTRPLDYRGTHFAFLANVMFKQSRVEPTSGERVFDLEHIAEQLVGLPDRACAEAAFGVGHHLAWIATSPGLRGGADLESLSLAGLLECFPVELEPVLARGVGGHLRRVFASGDGGRERAEELLGELLGERHPALGFAIEGLCADFGYPLAIVSGRELDLSHAIRGLVPESWDPAWRRGFERQCKALITRGFPGEVERARAELAGLSGPRCVAAQGRE